jgi:hypothetical protein
MARDRSEPGRFFVSLSRLHTTIIAAWLSMMVIMLIVRLAVGSQPFSVSELALWLTLGIPLFLVRRVFRGAPLTMAQLIRDTEHSGGSLRRKIAAGSRSPEAAE